MATPDAMPGFWIFMYRISPFTYLISSLLSTGLALNPVSCAPLEVLHIQPFPNQTCGEYMASYMSLAGGAVYNPNATSDCQFCAFGSTDEFLASVSSRYEDRWRNYGILWAYIVISFLVALGLYWVLRVPGSGRIWKRGWRGVRDSK